LPPDGRLHSVESWEQRTASLYLNCPPTTQASDFSIAATRIVWTKSTSRLRPRPSRVLIALRSLGRPFLGDGDWLRASVSGIVVARPDHRPRTLIVSPNDPRVDAGIDAKKRAPVSKPRSVGSAGCAQWRIVEGPLAPGGPARRMRADGDISLSGGAKSRFRLPHPGGA